LAFFDGLKGVIVKWLGIVPAQFNASIVVRENETHEIYVLRNSLWYRGDPVELEQFYKLFASFTINGYSAIPSTRFWAATPATNTLIRKMHSGLPRMIADKLAEIVVQDMNEVEMEEGHKQRWEEICEVNTFPELLKQSIVKALCEGDGAFKINIDTDLSDKPLLEFYSGNQVDYNYKRGQLQEIVYVTDYWTGKDKTQHYKLIETYGKGYVKYKLMDDNEKERLLETVPELAGLQDVTFDGDFIMGVPFKVKLSAKFAERGESIFEGKGDLFDAFDECISTWMDALRAGRVKQYIPDSLIPRDPEDGTPVKPDVFNPYIAKGSSLAEDMKEAIEVIQGDVKFDGLLSTYVTFLDMCLQGLISPSTLGIDVKKLDNAESQREKEKTTMYSRDNIIKVLSRVLPELVEAVLMAEDHMNKKQPETDYCATFEWGQYANPSFEAMVETIGKAKQFGVMSVEQCVEELYGDTMSEEDKKEEVERIKAEANPPVQTDEPMVDDVGGGLDESRV
jgi:hypothetical protein